MGKFRNKVKKFLYNRDQFWEDYRKKRSRNNPSNISAEISASSNKSNSPAIKTGKKIEPGQISLEGISPLNLNLNPKVPKKLRTCFVKNKVDNYIISEIFKETKHMEDIKHINEENVGIIEIEDGYKSRNYERKEVIKEIVNHTPLNSKLKLQEITFYFLFNPPPGYGEALKYCNPNIRIIYVGGFNGDYLFDLYDSVIIHESLSKNSNFINLRRVDY